jgi:ABC-2 type transport system permease protein
VQPIWSVASTMLFYGSPVIYTVESVPDDARSLYLLNPLAAILGLARRAVVDPSAPTLAEAAGHSAAWAAPLALLVGVCVAGFWFFNREAPRVAEEL